VMQPVRLGGCPIPTEDYVHMVLEMSRRCPSTGWVYRLLSSHSVLVSAFGEQAQDDVWGAGEHAVACSAYALTGTAVPVQGGYRISGRFPFSSGCDHAQWTVLGARVRQPDGSVDDTGRFFLVPMGDVEI